MRLLIRQATLVTVNASDEVLRDADLAIADGKIAGVGSAPAGFVPDRVIDGLVATDRGPALVEQGLMLATALAIKPIIEVVDGAVAEGGKQRTRSKALKFLVDKVAEYEGRMESVAVLHADCADVDQFVDMVRAHFDGEIVVGDIGPVVGTHAGRGTIGVGFITRD